MSIEFFRKAFNIGLMQVEFNDKMNSPRLYHLEDSHNNRVHMLRDKSGF